jgi:hypothetical protein
MTPGEQKQTRLLTRYGDGWAVGLAFLDAHQLLLAFEPKREARPVSLLIDFEESRVLPSKAKAPRASGELLSEASGAGLEARAEGGAIEVRKQGKRVKRLERAGKHPRLLLSASGDSVFSSATEVLNRWNLKTGKAQKYKCHDKATHVATIGNLLAAQNKEGVICLFDLAKGKRLVCVRPAANGWLAFADDGAWDSSEGFTRGAELSWTDAKSTAFVPDQGFGWLELNRFPLSRVVPPKAGRVKGLIALRTAGYW